MHRHHVWIIFQAMPELNKGCHKKCVYPDHMQVDKFTLHYFMSGGARQLYTIEELPDAVAKVMPAPGSPDWQEVYGQNISEHGSLTKLNVFPGAPELQRYSSMR